MVGGGCTYLLAGDRRRRLRHFCKEQPSDNGVVQDVGSMAVFTSGLIWGMVAAVSDSVDAVSRPNRRGNAAVTHSCVAFGRPNKVDES